MNNQKIIIFDGPDQCGKTEIAKKLSSVIGVPYFKNENERQGFKDDKDYFVNMTKYSDPFFISYLKQSSANIILDRSYPSEYVYCKAFNRATDWDTLKWIDEQYANLGALIIICHRTNYTLADDLCPNRLNVNKIAELDKHYKDFAQNYTKCNIKLLNVDDENLSREVYEILDYIKHQC